MEAKELRIGNKVKRSGVIVTIDARSIFDIWESIPEYEPIPLTEEWLIKLGFEKYEWCTDCAFISFNGGHMILRFYDNKWHCDKTKITKDSRGQKMSGGKPIVKKGLIKHVHQLQNLYFALTGEELKKL